MSRLRTYSGFFPAALLLALLIYFSQTHVENLDHVNRSDLPPTILWAWERPENLEFLDTKRYGVAFLAQTLVLKGDDVTFTPRRQPLIVSPETRLIAVTRIETEKGKGKQASLNVSQREEAIALILKTLELRNVSAIQVDFDAVTSERKFYRELLSELRAKLPEPVALSMTALASFCIGDRWLNGLPVDEAVPMIFRMGTDDQKIKTWLAEGHDFRAPLCRRSYGIAMDEPVKLNFDAARRLYVFNVRPWTERDVLALEERILE